jgi:hypothetical protein
VQGKITEGRNATMTPTILRPYVYRRVIVPTRLVRCGGLVLPLTFVTDGCIISPAAEVWFNRK